MRNMNHQELVNCIGGGFFSIAFKVIASVITLIDAIAGIRRRWRS